VPSVGTASHYQGLHGHLQHFFPTISTNHGFRQNENGRKKIICLSTFQVGLASGLGQYTQVVREAQKGIKLRNVRFVDAMGLPLQDGHLHLSTQAQVQLGNMLAQSYLNYGTSRP
jgi:hypothetical protein